ncbi:hypothetical protein SIM91_01365 [Rhodococcus opacus]|uniref:hypothetical protein n=1 Tax=Rhodococcus opacus TaxID=37919 RepID=UPI0029C1FA0E|nr:hypothetical protein [Rhodococcus opacus]MDX5961999.1 hypothetical protein [Rhodococcus opacus]
MAGSAVVVLQPPPSWTVLASWHRPEVVSIELLELEHPALVDAAASQHRVLDR